VTLITNTLGLRSSAFDLFDGIPTEQTQQALTFPFSRAPLDLTRSLTGLTPKRVIVNCAPGHPIPNQWCPIVTGARPHGRHRSQSDDPGDPNAWMWSLDDDDVTKKACQTLFLIHNFPLLTRNTAPPLAKTPAPMHYIASASSSVSPSPFALPSRVSNYNPHSAYSGDQHRR
jgi:hypothetical protein